MIDLSRPLAEIYDGLIVDADGVLFRGAEPVPHAAATLDAVHSRLGRDWFLVTNNAANSPDAVAKHLQTVGIDLEADRIITSPDGAVGYLQQRGIPAGSHVMVVGGAGIEVALACAGYTPVRARSTDSGEKLAAVVQGFGPELTWRDLAEASFAIEAGAIWVATNADLTLPTSEGLAPGNGSLVDAVANAVGRTPDAVTGKPEPLLLRLAAKRGNLTRPLVVGDRIDTDIRGGNRAGMDTLLVLTGVTGEKELAGLREAPAEDRPTYLAADLRALLDPARESVIGRGDAMGAADGLAGIRMSLSQAWEH